MRATVLLVLLAGCGGVQYVEGYPPNELHTPGAARVASLGANVDALTEADPTDDRGAHMQTWTVDLDPSQRVALRMSSDAIDPMLELEGPGLSRVSNDDAFPGTLDAMIEFVPPRAGTYTIRATTASARQRGPYALTIEARPDGGVGVPFQLGVRSVAQLGQPTRIGYPGTWMFFQASAGSIVRLRVTSQAFDTVATLLGPTGERWDNDDANDLGPNGSERALDSTIVAALPNSGIYQLVVTSYGGQGMGPFALASSVRPPLVLPSNGHRPDGVAGPEGGGRVLGLYAGITAYQGRPQLYGCADDALLLGAAMRAAHLQDETEQLLLPDGLATRQAVVDGLSQIARMAQPQDVVLIFYSGHGGQTAVRHRDSRELDGMDETIILYDGEMTDDDLVAAIDPIRASTVILALDSCHSGGFADDFATRPGRVGIYSSDEDVLSDVAEPHGAGGYLSWFLRRGVLGEADSRPRDGVLHAGELTDYLYTGFVHDHALINPDTDQEPMQYLVVRRGSVSWEQLLWVYPRNADLSLPEAPNLPLQSPPP